MSTYKLVNPHIEGNCNKSFSGKNEHEVALKAWSTLSKFFTNNVPKFAFSLKNEHNNKLIHFLVKEKLDDAGIVDYNISKLDDNDVGELKQQHVGGKHHKHHRHHKDKMHKNNEDDSSSSSSSSSSDEEIFKKLNNYRLYQSQPIYYWWYDPCIYKKLRSIYIPTFVQTVIPYIEIATYYPYGPY